MSTIGTEAGPAERLAGATAAAEARETAKGLVFDIQGHSVHDGPGTRTTVFLAGCPLECVWCCNPEGLFTKPVVVRREPKCKRCGRCLEACPKHAITLDDAGRAVFDRSRCDDCTTHECVANCYHEALEVSGKWMTVDELMRLFARDRQFWGSRGGVTFSGGEPLRQRDFILPLLRRCTEARIHTAIETTACVARGFFLEALRHVDWMFVDIKQMDPAKHRELTGAGNELILSNIREVAGSDWPGFMVVRIPVIPGCNDSEENIRATARFVKEVGLEVINLLPFHRLGESKYRQLGKRYAFQETEGVPVEALDPLKRIVEAEGLTCYTGWRTPF